MPDWSTLILFAMAASILSRESSFTHRNRDLCGREMGTIDRRVVCRASTDVGPNLCLLGDRAGTRVRQDGRRAYSAWSRRSSCVQCRLPPDDESGVPVGCGFPKRRCLHASRGSVIMLITLQSHSCNRDHMFDRDLILDEFDSFHHQAKNLLLRFKARVIERCADITTKFLDSSHISILSSKSSREPAALSFLRVTILAPLQLSGGMSHMKVARGRLICFKTVT